MNRADMAEDYKNSFLNLCKISPEKLVFASVIVLYFFNYIFIGKFPLNVVPILVGIPAYFIFALSSVHRLNARYLASWLFLVAFSVLAQSYLLIENGIRVVMSMEFFFVFSLPILYLAAMQCVTRSFIKYVSSGLLIFLVWQLIVVLGQISKNVFGVGFSLPASYSDGYSIQYANMLTGTFYNANDLAATCGMVFLFFLIIQPLRPLVSSWAIAICLVLSVLTLSRSVLVFIMFSLFFVALFRSPFKSMLVAILLGATVVIGIYLLQQYLGHYPFVERIVTRINSIFTVLDRGLGADGSLSLRTVSYLHFLGQIDALGVGTISYQDYTRFVGDLGPGYELMAVNPHSFLVEVGYWLGWAGLFTFGAAMFLIVPKNYFLFLYCLLSFSVLSMVSSSVFGNFVFFMVLFLVLGLLMFPLGRARMIKADRA